MSLPFYIAKRYLFSKKSHNAINIISGISAVGVCAGTFALVCVLSVFNGFGNMVEDMFSCFDPDLKIQKVQGKSFMREEAGKLESIRGVATVTDVIEENALFRSTDKQQTGTVKGVTENFGQMSGLDSILIDGEYKLEDGAFRYGIPGVGLAANIGLNPHTFDALYIYAPKREGQVNLANPENSFNSDKVFVSGVFSVQQADYDNDYLILPIGLVRELFEYEPGQVTSVEIGIGKGADLTKVKKAVQETVGDDFKVLDRYEQQEDYFKIMKVEKWITYLILSFILLIAVFNIIGSLSMLIIDKSGDIRTLRNMGATQGLVRRIFTLEGWMITLLGCVTGIVAGVAVCLLQQHVGFIHLPGEVNPIPYPVQIEASDILIIFVTVSAMGLAAAYYPARQIKMTY
ncbi:MAG: ABC transporter permease [Paludibacteraceae bacterium]|nr:ABC transporter permease [Paludibacteraceae bacterium]